MARASNRDILSKYRKNITHSKKWRREEELDDLWRRMVELYRGRHFGEYSDEDRMLINRAFATINVIWPSVSVNHPKVTVSARREEDADRATITEAVVNYWWRHYECQPEFRLAVKDMLIIGHGWIKVGYKYVEEEREVERSEEEAAPAMEPMLSLDFEEEATASVADMAVETELVVLEDRPFIERVSPFDVFVDPDATCEREMRWIAHRIKRPLKEVKADKRYNKSARSEVQPAQYSKWSTEGDKPRRSRNPEDGYVEIWEFYDILKGTLSVFADGSDNFLVNPVKMPYAFGHPFVMIRNYDVPEYFYPIGELEAIEPLQHELNETRTQMMNHRKRFSRKWLFKESAFDPDGRNALQSQDDNVLVPVVGDEPLGAVIAPMPAVINPPEFYNQSQLISSDIDTVTGVSEYMRGGMPEIRRTATEAAIMQDASNARSSEKLAIIELAIGQVAKRLVALAQQYMTGEQVARVAGSQAMPMWITFDRDYIAGEFDFEVEGGSTQPVNESFRRQMALQLVDAMVPFASAGIVDMTVLARHILQYGFGVKTPEAFLAPSQPQMMPGQEQMPPEQMGMEGLPPEVATGMEGIPTGGEAMPSSIPPGVLAGLLGQSGALAPNTAPMA
jgi:hypothetical protein